MAGKHWPATLTSLREDVVNQRNGTHLLPDTVSHVWAKIVYSHVVPGLQEAAARRFDEALSPMYNKLIGKGEDIDAISNVH